MKRIKLLSIKIRSALQNQHVDTCEWITRVEFVNDVDGRSFQNFHRGIRITRPTIYSSKQFPSPPPPPRLFYSKVRTRSLCYRGGKGRRVLNVQSKCIPPYGVVKMDDKAARIGSWKRRSGTWIFVFITPRRFLRIIVMATDPPRLVLSISWGTRIRLIASFISSRHFHPSGNFRIFPRKVDKFQGKAKVSLYNSIQRLDSWINSRYGQIDGKKSFRKFYPFILDLSISLLKYVCDN